MEQIYINSTTIALKQRIHEHINCSEFWVTPDNYTFYLTLLVFVVVFIGFPPAIFVITVIEWYPDLFEKSKHIFQGYSIFSSIFSTLTAGYIILAASVPTVYACRCVLFLSHLAISLFLTSEFLVQIDFYVAIILPFFHEESFNREGVPLFLSVTAILFSLTHTVFLAHLNYFNCDDVQCPGAVIHDLAHDVSLTKSVMMATVALSLFIVVTTLHVTCIVLSPSTNAVHPQPQENESSTEQSFVTLQEKDTETLTLENLR